MPSIPPGFESFVPFSVKKAENHRVGSYSSSGSAVEPRIKLEIQSDCNDDPKTTKSLRRRSGVKYNQHDNSSDNECESEQVVISLVYVCVHLSLPMNEFMILSHYFLYFVHLQRMFLMDQLPKGVIRGCEACKNCQKASFSKLLVSFYHVNFWLNVLLLFHSCTFKYNYVTFWNR